MEKTICFDLEGPLSPQDNAYEVLKLVGKGGASVFEVISRYDDVISLEERQGYEPGDTLALIVPFFLLHGITEEDIERVSKRAKIVEGAENLFKRLLAENWDVFIISTSYRQHAYYIGRKLGISEDHILCTELDLEKSLQNDTISAIEEVEEAIIELHSDMDNANRIVKRLDEFFFHQLPSLGFDIFTTRVVGGERKADAVRVIAHEKGIKLRDIIVVGDSITDYKMLKEVAAHGGLSVAFNGNEYAVPYANVGLASVDIRFLYIVCDAFARGGKGEAMEVVTTWEENREGFKANPEVIPDGYITADIKDFISGGKQAMSFPYFHNLERADKRRAEEIIALHKQLRMRLREDAGKLG
jgi:energy-converting hydrogenase A subunit R